MGLTVVTRFENKKIKTNPVVYSIMWIAPYIPLITSIQIFQLGKVHRSFKKPRAQPYFFPLFELVISKNHF